MHKPCQKCGLVKPLIDYHNNRTRPDGKHDQCKLCRNNYNKSLPKDHPVRVRAREHLNARSFDDPKREAGRVRSRLRSKTRTKEQRRTQKLRRLYGITLEDQNRILEGQGGVCAICGTDNWTAAGPSIDHDHATGEIRGVLCNRCNAGIGFLNEDITRFRNAIVYLTSAKRFTGTAKQDPKYIERTLWGHKSWEARRRNLTNKR
jgi:hypothetical protein